MDWTGSDLEKGYPALQLYDLVLWEEAEPGRARTPVLPPVCRLQAVGQPGRQRSIGLHQEDLTLLLSPTRHDDGRSGAGLMPCSFSVFAIVLGATLCPRFFRAPSMRQ